MNVFAKSAVIGAGLLALTFAGDADAGNFSERSVRGQYAFTMNGVITYLNGKPLGAPTFAVGVFHADGRGNIKHIDDIFNVAGCVNITYSGAGTYTVKRNGRGSASVLVKAEEVVLTDGKTCPTLPYLPPEVIFEFEFSLKRDGRDADTIGTFVKDANTLKPILAWGGHGSITRQ